MLNALCILLFHLTPFTADKVEIVKDRGISVIYLMGNVVIEPESTKITCAQAWLNEVEGYIRLFQRVMIADPAGDIKADQAVYYLNDKRAFLTGAVELSTENERITSDTLDYDGAGRYVQMYSNVKIVDNKNALTAYGDRGQYDLNKDTGTLTGNPHLEIARANKDTLAERKEPMNVKAREFRLFTANNVFWGYDSVLAVIDSTDIACDTFSYNLKTESGTMVRPIITQSDNELKGTVGSFQLKDKNIDYFATEEGRARYLTKEGSTNIVDARAIIIFFKDGAASKIVAQGDPKGRLKQKKEPENAGH